MKPRELCTKINEFLEQGFAEGVFLAIQTHLLDHTTIGETLTPPNAIGMLSDRGVSLDEYVALLEGNRYSAVCDDYALLTIECTFIRGKLESHRYGYIPCPFDQELMSLRPEDVTMADWIKESVLPIGNSAFRSVGTYRFDCVRKPPKKSDAPHPVSHLTFASPDCRIPIRSPLSLSSFFDFLFDNFYRHHANFWRKYSPFMNCVGTDDTISADELVRHHLSWLDAI